jgi:hypothetical protein
VIFAVAAIIVGSSGDFSMNYEVVINNYIGKFFNAVISIGLSVFISGLVLLLLYNLKSLKTAITGILKKYFK